MTVSIEVLQPISPKLWSWDGSAQWSLPQVRGLALCPSRLDIEHGCPW